MRKFSVLIANYNGARYLEECFNSLKKQTYNNIEIIFVDDCSTDSSVSIVNKIKKESNLNIILECNSKNRGCGYTKARSIELASGDFCGFLDSDDALKPDAIEKMVHYHELNSDCGLISSRYYICDKNLKVLYPSPNITEKNFKNYLYTPKLTHFNTFKRDLYLKTEGISKTITHGVDQDLCLKMEEISPIKFVSDVFYLYRTYSKSISHGTGEQKATFYNMLIRIDACRRRNIDVSQIQGLFRFIVPKHNCFISFLIKKYRVFLFKLKKDKNKITKK